MKIFVRVKPQARKNELKKISDLDYIAHVKEPAKEGRANEAVRRLIAEYFGVSRSHVRLMLGKTAREKLFEVVLP